MNVTELILVIRIICVAAWQKGHLSPKHEMVVKHAFTKLYTLPKACF